MSNTRPGMSKRCWTSPRRSRPQSWCRSLLRTRDRTVSKHNGIWTKHAALDHARGVGKHHAPGNPGYLTAIEVCLYGVSVARQAQSSPSATPARKTPAKTSAKPRAEVRWEGDSKEVLCGWSPAIRTDFGIALEEMQEGRPANLEVRAMPSIGKGVYRLKTDDEARWYGLMYLARIDNVIHVLDCFEKNTRKAEIKDLDRSLSRLKRVQDRLLEKRKNAK